MAQYAFMFTTARLRFAGTLLVSVLAFALTLVAPAEVDLGEITVASAPAHAGR